MHQRIVFQHTYHDIISLENLLAAWKEFVVGKHQRHDVQIFERNLMENIITLHTELSAKIYKHSAYEAFTISDPKQRIIHKARVRDRLLHHAVFRLLHPFFDRTFIADSYSCRKNKGTHKAINKFRTFSLKVSKNNTKTVWVLKCDIKKFFASINHDVLMNILQKYIFHEDVCWLLNRIIGSFYSAREGIGLPLGNLTSQLFANVCMNEFDQHVKHKLKAVCYIRYADDFVVLSQDRNMLERMLPCIQSFLETRLYLQLHPDKVFIKTLASGTDFLGWVHFPDHRVLRTATKRRIFQRVRMNKQPASIQSYLGLLGHGNAHKLQERVLTIL